ncbi:tetratricopeptide repeat protein [Staphylococcus sp. SQ8-PEA]|uniref:Tetratricopeptide repeat protein n=1 Tax=Staphylococcus marylandisciuri TaxID=2981529 RepID=A0ABT2QR35_9STAP|nr:tetratricopeptide repeat protein [Staphylococcus marylandisciuri]MCU5746434.1 tetratricopeptide repeat protein [Staphylococcus marylandisciuri]
MEQEQIYDLIKKGEVEQALQALFNNIERRPKEVENYINAGILIAEAGEVEKAEKFFQRALTLDSENSAVFYNLANIYYNEGRYNEAIKLYQQALQLPHVHQVDVNYMIGMSFNQLSAHKEALPYLMRAAELDDDKDVEVHFQYGLVLCHLEMYEQAVNQLDKVLNEQSDHVDALYNKGLAHYMLTENKEEAMRYFKKAIDISPDHHMSQHALQTFKQL